MKSETFELLAECQTAGRSMRRWYHALYQEFPDCVGVLLRIKLVWIQCTEFSVLYDFALHSLLAGSLAAHYERGIIRIVARV